MSMVTLTIQCPDPDCEHEFDVEADVDPGESNFGADADGNRGIYVPAWVVPPDDVLCPKCGANCDEVAKQQAEDYKFSEPEYDGLYDTLEERDLDRDD